MMFENDGSAVYAVLHDGSRTLYAVAVDIATAETITVSLQERWNRISA